MPNLRSFLHFPQRLNFSKAVCTEDLVKIFKSLVATLATHCVVVAMGEECLLEVTKFTNPVCLCLKRTLGWIRSCQKIVKKLNVIVAK